MAEETINEVIDGFSTALSKLERENREYAAELETVRAERDALRVALENIDLVAVSELNFPTHIGKHPMVSVRDIVAAALNTQPQAEWTPKVGDFVRVKDDAIEMAEWRGFDGVVENRYIGRAVVCRADVELNVPIDELAPVDESEA